MKEKMLKIYNFIISNEGDRAVRVGSEGLGSREIYAEIKDLSKVQPINFYRGVVGNFYFLFNSFLYFSNFLLIM